MTIEDLARREAERKLYGKGLTRAEAQEAWELLLRITARD